MSNLDQNNSNQNFAHQHNGKEQVDTATAGANTFPGGFQAIATAYGNYTTKSIEVQTEFAKTAYETFVAESQKIGALYGDLAKQSYKPLSGFVAMMTPKNR